MTANREPWRRKSWEEVLPDPGIVPGGIRDRAIRAVMRRGPQPEDKEKTMASQKFSAANDNYEPKAS